MDRQWECVILENPNNAFLDIRIYRFADEYIEAITPSFVDGRITWIVVRHEEGEEIAPTIRLPRMGRGTLQPLADALHRDMGVIPQTVLNQDALDATKDHLEDLRSILFGFDTAKLERVASMEVSDASI